MKNLFYPLAGALIIAWAVIYLKFNRGGIFHLLLVAGIALFVIRVMQRKSSDYS